MKRRLKVRLALILAFTMLLGSGIAAFGGKSEVEVIPSGSGIVPTVYNDPQAPEIQGYSSERHESSKIGDHSLLGGKIIVSVFEGVYKNKWLLTGFRQFQSPTFFSEEVASGLCFAMKKIRNNGYGSVSAPYRTR